MVKPGMHISALHQILNDVNLALTYYLQLTVGN